MATAPSRTHRRSTGDAGSRRDERLAELVAGLAGCDDDLALDAVRAQPDPADPLETVARAIAGIRRAETEPQDRLRVAGFLRSDRRRLPRRPRGGAIAVVDRAEDHLVHHGSLRRWERTGAEETTAADALPSSGPVGDDQVIDLRDRTARFRRPAPGYDLG